MKKLLVLFVLALVGFGVYQTGALDSVIERVSEKLSTDSNEEKNGTVAKVVDTVKGYASDAYEAVKDKVSSIESITDIVDPNNKGMVSELVGRFNNKTAEDSVEQESEEVIEV